MCQQQHVTGAYELERLFAPAVDLGAECAPCQGVEQGVRHCIVAACEMPPRSPSAHQRFEQQAKEGKLLPSRTAQRGLWSDQRLRERSCARPRKRADVDERNACNAIARARVSGGGTDEGEGGGYG